MAPSIWDDSVRASIADRAQRVTPDARPRWGKMNASAMMAHMNDALRMALGELRVQSKNLRLMQLKPIRKLVIYYLPIPKGAPTAPELIARCPTAVLDDEKRAFAELMHRLGTVRPDATLGEHPLFGNLSYDEFGALIAKHSDHHLRQFGV
jgi:Protein of unknown function (DUF1569)